MTATEDTLIISNFILIFLIAAFFALLVSLATENIEMAWSMSILMLAGEGLIVAVVVLGGWIDG